MAVLLAVLSLLIPILLTFVFLPQTLLRLLAWPLGIYLGRACRARRQLLLDRTERDEKEYAAGQKTYKKDEGDRALDDIKADHDWCGFVGFFHPFW